MNKLDYEKALRSLIDHRGFVYPCLDNIKLFCPHLTEEQMASVLEKDTYFACPSLFVKNAFIVLHYNTYKDRNILQYAFACHTLQSYADGKLHGDIEHKYIFMDEAIAYANEHWGDTLILDDWKAFMTIHIQDPTKLDKHNHPTNVFNLNLALRRDYNEFINEYDKPHNEIFDEEIIIATTDILISDEIRGGRGGYTNFNCAHCGGGLTLKSCTACDNEFGDDHFRSGWHTPLSDKMIKALTDAGHVFAIDPKIAQDKYRVEFNKMIERWAEEERSHK